MAGSVGAIIAISALVFIILGCIQADWFSHALGTIGDPHSWPLWTISGGGLLISGALISYVILSKNSDDTTQAEGLESEFVRKSFQGKKSLEELFSDEPHLLGEIPPGTLSKQWVVGPEIETAPMIKGHCHGNAETPFIALKIKCVGSDDKIAGKLNFYIPLNTPSEVSARVIGEAVHENKMRPALLVFIRLGSRWFQRWDQDFKYSRIMPSFIRDKDNNYFSGGILNENLENAEYIEQEEIGFTNLKKLMKGERVTDQHGLEWVLDGGR